MSLNTALSGLLNAQDGLNVVSNNLANAGTVGFKSGSAQFSDIYAAGGTNGVGQGAAAAGTQQDFSQGNLMTTGNPLNLAIQGNGFFITAKDGTTSYSRDGAFQLSPTGELLNGNGSAVQGFGVKANGQANGLLGPVTISTGPEPAKATGQVNLNAALNSADPVITSAFSPSNPATYDQATSVTAYDTLGNANRVQLYFARQPSSASATTPNPWTIYAQPQSASGSSVGTPATLTTLTFNSSGALTGGGSATLNVNWGNGAASSNIGFDFAGTTLSNQSFAVNSLTNDGYAAGNYTGTAVDAKGNVNVSYSNGQSKTVATLALASFINNQGLTPTSGNLFQPSTQSGVAAVNQAGAGVNGTLVSGSLEKSNVQTSNALVELLNYQEAYQANTSVIQGAQRDVQKLLQLS
ncbi:flagellar hook protein FlgE [Defluviimonas sp. 20V17]|uniref:Flagellar hook protein FlgE n=1 Tax=Allgaiera indica TaxID=765699 RepID=A0AAN4UN86_9RHOB|nr:flagellar hook protein FlgE [Allgaiera indica]KDB03486.1 flagellar hook protein FlgE [Defluviimonas sp. 20V17]GHD98122.1 flagellar hook protein FlgE [Allgaiera indica]SDW53441.1 flagellar hook protein FlgE [Allgaiera indica]